VERPFFVQNNPTRQTAGPLTGARRLGGWPPGRWSGRVGKDSPPSLTMQERANVVSLSFQRLLLLRVKAVTEVYNELGKPGGTLPKGLLVVQFGCYQYISGQDPGASRARTSPDSLAATARHAPSGFGT
jgi:hypothetical protein